MQFNVRGADAYRRIEAQSRSPMELVVLLYDGALRFVSEAQQGDARGDVAARQNGVSRTLAIIAHLQSTLNMAEGGAVAEELERLYVYMMERLLDATAKRDSSALAEVHALLTTLREAWAQAAQPGSPGR